MSRSHQLVWLLMLLLTVASCRHRVAEAPAEATGQAGIRFIDPAAAPGAVLQTREGDPVSGEVFSEARAIEPLTVPVYPRGVPPRKAGVVTIGVRLTVDEQGRVTDVGPSLLAVSIPTPYSEQFEAAVRAAVLQWRFQPAQRYRVDYSRNAQSGLERKVSGRANVETWFDVMFTFTERGEVKTGPAAGAR